MVTHLAFLGVAESGKPDASQAFQKAAETYVAILLALMTPLSQKP
jgi:hypothetical protein